MAVKILYYALGGGIGHLSRSYAILNSLYSLSRLPLQITLVTNSPFAHLLAKLVAKLVMVNSAKELPTILNSLLAALPDLMIVDTFPRGLMGELSEIYAQFPQLSKILIQRYLHERYVEKFELAKFTAQHYQLSLRLSDNLPLQDLCIQTVDLSPVIIDPSYNKEIVPLLFSTEQKNRLLFIDFGSAADPYIRMIGDEFSLNIVTLDLSRQTKYPQAINYYPAISLISQAEIVIGSCGYNLYHEVASLNARAIFLPQLKTYDDQLGRARGTVYATTPLQFREILESSRWTQQTKQPPRRSTGSSEAANEILKLILEQIA